MGPSFLLCPRVCVPPGSQGTTPGHTPRGWQGGIVKSNPGSRNPTPRTTPLHTPRGGNPNPTLVEPLPRVGDEATRAGKEDRAGGSAGREGRIEEGSSGKDPATVTSFNAFTIPEETRAVLDR